jgi:hypothetical protein
VLSRLRVFAPAAHRMVAFPLKVWASTLALTVPALIGIPGARFALHASPPPDPVVSAPPELPAGPASRDWFPAAPPADDASGTPWTAALGEVPSLEQAKRTETARGPRNTGLRSYPLRWAMGRAISTAPTRREHGVRNGLSSINRAGALS